MVDCARFLQAAVAVGLATFLSSPSSASAAPPFEHLGQQGGPGGTFDVLTDGRLIGMSGDQVLIESAPQSGVFNLAGYFEPGHIGEFGASFLSVSPDGSRFMVGDGRFGSAQVYEVEISQLNGGALSPRAYAHENFTAAWYDSNRIAISAADPSTFLGEVRILDLGTGVSTRIIALDGASGGISFDRDGNLFTGNGFDFLPGGSDTGDIRAFLAADIDDVLNGRAGVIEFATGGQFIGRVLSAASLEFDTLGHLFIGGADFDRGEIDYFALADSQAVLRALMNGQPLGFDDLFQDDPDPSPFSFYTARFNAFTNEWLVASGSSLTLYRYGVIPAPGSAIALASLAGWLLVRRRREDGRRP